MSKYVKLGRTNLEVATVSFGGIPIQRDGVENTVKIIDSLIECGMNYIDTARAYTVSEKYLGEALLGRRNQFILATKSMDRTYEGMKSDIDSSLKDLKTDYIDVYQVHNVKDFEYDNLFSHSGAYRALVEAKEDGKIGFIGVTIHSVDSLKIVVEKYPLDFDTVMFPFNIVELQGKELLLKAQELGIGTISMKPLAGGNIDDYMLAIKFILADGCCDITIPGMGNVDEVIKNANAWNSAGPLSDDEQLEVIKLREELGENFCRRCGYCMPCSVGIDIPSNFLMKNYLNKYEGLQNWAKSRYASFAIKAKDCVKCGKCEPKCPYNLPIIKMLEEVEESFNY